VNTLTGQKGGAGVTQRVGRDFSGLVDIQLKDTSNVGFKYPSFNKL